VFEDQLNPIHRFFSIRHIYTKVNNTHTTMGKLHGTNPEFTIYAAKKQNEYPPIIIFDKGHNVNPSDPNLSLQLIDDPEMLTGYVYGISPAAYKEMKNVILENGIHIEEDDKDAPTFDKVLARSGLCYQPTRKLRNPDYIKEMDWSFFVERLIRWESKEKDQRLNLIHKAMLLRGIEARVNTHALIVTNAGTGKSIHFQVHGINYDKVTKNSFLGFAKSPKEIFKGTVDGTDLPIGIDQIEIGNWGIMDFMFNAMERGEAMISSGSVNIPIKTCSPIALIANPLGEAMDPEKGFGYILSHLSNNPAIGRRFGILCYGIDYKVITTRSTQASMDLWAESSTFFRAIEEYARPEMIKIYRSDELWAYLQKEIPGYYEQFQEIAHSVHDFTIRTFLLEHGKAGQSRVRAAAFNASLIDHLNEIALGNYSIADIVDHADEVILPAIIQINLESANNIVKTLGNEKLLLAEAYLRSVPDYMREIIYAVERARQEQHLFSVFLFSTLEYAPICSAYQTLNQCVKKLLGRKRGLAEYNQACVNHYAFGFEPYSGDLRINLIIKSYPKLNIPLGIIEKTQTEQEKLGKMGKTGKSLPDLPNTTSIPTFRDPLLPVLEDQKIGVSKYGIMGKTGKSGKLMFGEQLKLMLSKMVSGVAYNPLDVRDVLGISLVEADKILKTLLKDHVVYQKGDGAYYKA